MSEGQFYLLSMAVLKKTTSYPLGVTIATSTIVLGLSEDIIEEICGCFDDTSATPTNSHDTVRYEKAVVKLSRFGTLIMPNNDVNLQIQPVDHLSQVNNHSS
jgi:hypothetical protein